MLGRYAYQQQASVYCKHRIHPGEHSRKMRGSLVTSLNTDTETQLIVRAMPKNDYGAVLKVAKSARFVCNESGSDGARTRDLCLDRAAC